MSIYFDEQESIFEKLNEDMEGVLEVISNAYIGRNPSLPFTFRCFSRGGFLQRNDGRYVMNLGEKLPEASFTQYGYVFGMFWCHNEYDTEFALNCYGPATIYLNRKFLYKADIVEEVNCKVKKTIQGKLEKGWNSILIKFKKTASGFGGVFGSAHSKWYPLDIITPFKERLGQAGWLYSESLNYDAFPNEESIPDHLDSEKLSKIVWYPKTKWDEEQEKQNSCTRIFGTQSNKTVYMWSAVNNATSTMTQCSINGFSNCAIKLWIDDNMVFSGHLDGKSNVGFKVKPGKHNLFIELISANNGWDYDIKFLADEAMCSLAMPYNIKGAPSPWLYLGAFNSPLAEDVSGIRSLYRLFEQDGSSLYWRMDMPDTWVRPYLENPLFAKWNYPLGVTLYGLIQTGRVLGNKNIVDYVIAHITECTSLYKYSVWDKEQYGYPSINHQLVELNMLDDCGSFGSVMLEAYVDSKDSNSEYLAKTIADYMENNQERLEDGAFCRNVVDTFNEKTMWADDLYMSTPFLTRYYKLTGDVKYLDDAAKQFLLFKKYLFIPELKIMSHVYDFKYNTATYVPWGRGNGWVFFSLSELLEAMPETHKNREELLKFFNELAEGYMALQGKHGLWHQVLTHTDSYEETSCTSMFIYGLSRGIRLGWLWETMRNKAVNAINKGWEGITKYSVDKSGNVHGVCMGSRYSFTADYYMNDLGWITNDTHGIGIVMLAGIEKTKMAKWLEHEYAESKMSMKLVE